MAPEQLHVGSSIPPSHEASADRRSLGGGGKTGPTATIKSDIYALGLVLFEIFTGRRAYEANTLADLIKAHESGAITTPSSVVRDLDPAIERTILRCLDAIRRGGPRPLWPSPPRCREAIPSRMRLPPAKLHHRT
jgi:serine/threonine protein kinase